MKTERLTTLTAVKEWLGLEEGNTSSDAQLTRLIEAASRFILNYLNWRSFKPTLYTDIFTGNGKPSMLLPNWPVISITSVDTAGVSVSASTFNAGVPNSGYYLSDGRMASSSVILSGYNFVGPCKIVYEAGFQGSDTYTLVDVDGNVTLTPSESGQWIEDISVTIAGADAVKVSQDPQPGEYAVSEWGVYSFNVADAGSDAVITYAYAPSDVAFVATEMVGEWLRRKDRIGLVSKSLSGGVGESVTFSRQSMNPSMRESLQSYMNVVPL